MKLLVWDCKFVRFKDKRPSSRPTGIKQILKGKSEGEFANTLLVFVCIEADDDKLLIQDAVDEIHKILDMLKYKRDITIVPFAHLSSSIAFPPKAIFLINELEEQLKTLNVNVNTVSFGYHKDFELHFIGRGHPCSVAYRELKHK
jgi:threonyl-tRNA synthetase